MSLEPEEHPGTGSPVDGEGAAVDTREISVLTVNLCVALPGLSNRHLPKLLIAGATPHVALVLVAAFWVGVPWWACVLAFPVVFPATVWSLGLPLARLMWPLWWAFGLDDFQHARIGLFLRMLAEQPDLAVVDVICVQECYSGLLFPGGYPELLAAGARTLGWRYAAVPPRWPAFPATLAANSGLLILSRRPILDWSGRAFGLSLEAANVNRGVLHARLEGGIHVFTCHLSPGPGIAGRGLAGLVGPLYRLARKRQIHELAAFIQRQAPSGATILAGDFNLDLPFDSFRAEPASSPFALELFWTLKSRCGLLEATSQVRGGGRQGVRASESETSGGGVTGGDTLRFLRPTFGYAGEDDGVAERWLTSFGNGQLRYACDDAVLFRDVDGVEVVEEALVIHASRRPHLDVTHLSDHWAVRAKLKLTQQSSAHAVPLLAPLSGASSQTAIAKSKPTLGLAKDLQRRSNGRKVCNGSYADDSS